MQNQSRASAPGRSGGVFNPDGQRGLRGRPPFEAEVSVVLRGPRQLEGADMTLELISHHLCPYVQRAAITLREKNVAFDRIDVYLSNKPDWFKAISPLGKAPLLRIDGQVRSLKARSFANIGKRYRDLRFRSSIRWCVPVTADGVAQSCIKGFTCLHPAFLKVDLMGDYLASAGRLHSGLDYAKTVKKRAQAYRLALTPFIHYLVNENI